MKPGDGVTIRVPTPIFEEEDSTRQRTTPTHQRKSLESFKRGGVEQSGAAAGSARRMRDGIRLVGLLSDSFCRRLVSAEWQSVTGVRRLFPSYFYPFAAERVG
jgi:hypothetical protein